MLVYRVTFLLVLSLSSHIALSQVKTSEVWIKSIRKYDYKEDNLLLLKQFESFIKPDTLDGASDTPHLNKGILDTLPGGILTPMFVNLDSDSTEELIGIFGYARHNPMLAVFKKIDGNWCLIYHEAFYMFYTEPELEVANNFSPNKTFYIRCVYERGSGIYQDGFQFYKLIDNKVYRCLNLLNEGHIYGWGLTLNQAVNVKFGFNSANADELWAEYKYDFFPADDLRSNNSKSTSFIKNENTADFHWDSVTRTYKFEPALFDSLQLNEKKITALTEFGNDTLFVKAFTFEINQALHEGTRKQRRLLRKYLKMVASKHGVSITRETMQR